MNARAFDYHSPRTVDEALALAERFGQDAKFLAGGQSLIPMMKLRIASPAHLIDLGRIATLSYIREEGEFLTVGATTRMAEVAASPVVARECRLVAQCASQIADPLVRNMGTIGGNLSHADPSNDMPAVMLATESQIVATSSRGRRTIQSTEFFVDTFTTALKEGEILTEIRVPRRNELKGAYLKLGRQTGDFGIVGVAAAIEIGGDGNCSYCGIGLTGVGPTAIKAREAEAILVGKRVSQDALDEAGRAAAEASRPTGDLRGSAEYKRKMVKVMTVRALQAALQGGWRA